MTRQFQILGGNEAVIEVTETRVTPMGAGQIKACFVRVGGVIFELMQVV